MCVRWGGTYSTFVSVTNGVRQGSIVSPYLFNIYVDDLSVALNACRVGCCVMKVLINHIMHADDLVILAPSVSGLSKLLSICEIFGESNDIIFNQKKSASLYFISKMDWLCWRALNGLRTGVGRAKTVMRRWGYLDDAQSVDCDCGEPQTMAHLLSCRLLDEACTADDLATVTERAKACARKWEKLCEGHERRRRFLKC